MSCRKTSRGSEAKCAQWSWALKFCQEMQVIRKEDVFLGPLAGMHPRALGILAHLLRMVMEPKWTSQSSSENMTVGV